jgi:hypothetical protein
MSWCVLGPLKMPQTAIETEVQEFLEPHAGRRDGRGKRLVVVNGHLPIREIFPRNAKMRSTSLIPRPSAFYHDYEHRAPPAVDRRCDPQRAGLPDPLPEIDNQIFRSNLPSRVQVTAQERERSVKFGSKLGKALGERKEPSRLRWAVPGRRKTKSQTSLPRCQRLFRQPRRSSCSATDTRPSPSR